MMSDIPGTVGFSLPVRVAGQVSDGSPAPRVAGLTVTPNFLDVLDASVLTGRGFTVQDRVGSEPVMLVNQRFAAQFFPDRSPVGRTVQWGRGQPRTVVGVVPDLFMGSLDRPNANGPGVYLPLAQAGNVSMQIMVRTAQDPLGLTSQVRDALESLDPTLALMRVDRVDRFIARGTVVFEIFGQLFLFFGLTALFLASIGLYGVMALTERAVTFWHPSYRERR
jgi:ABC-type antimicrobial peptide transport system permease subunit